MDEIRLPRYLHEAIPVLWFDSNEIIIIVFFYIFANIAGGVFWLLSPVAIYWFICENRENGRGYIQRFLYSLGLLTYQGYPDTSADIFYE
jgi:hypothetical protein